MTPGTEDAPSRSFAELEQDLPLLAQRYELSQLRGWSYLPHGLMNPNWQVTADAGVFALKRLVDVSAERAERNLAMPQALVSAGIPACVARPADDGSLVVQVSENHAYALFDWVIGEHIPGGELTVAQAAYLGDLLGRLHVAME